MERLLVTGLGLYFFGLWMHFWPPIGRVFFLFEPPLWVKWIFLIPWKRYLELSACVWQVQGLLAFVLLVFVALEVVPLKLAYGLMGLGFLVSVFGMIVVRGLITRSRHTRTRQWRRRQGQADHSQSQK